ncbi:MAG: cobalamin-independent methionine synthase II family protein [Thermomicrobiales bacterium]|nr:cobalamin-independent methionine synthase II family protein [Thermomicrobiales bacterium]
MKKTLDDLPLLPASAVGSHAPTGWLLTAIDAIARGEMGQDDIDELMRDATDIAVLDMERAGLDVLVDGEMRRNDFNLGFYVRIAGIEPMAPARLLGPEGHDQRGKWRVSEDISAPNGLGCVEDWSYVQQVSDRPVKACVPGPFTLSGRLQTGGIYKDRVDAAWALVPIVNAECRALQAAGATFIQVDEPSAAVYPDKMHEYVRIFNAAVEGIDARIGSHICFGNFRGRPVAHRTYRPIFPTLFDMHCNQYLLEFANREMAEIELWQEFPNDRELGCGVIDVKNYWCETPEVVAARIRTALRFVAPEKLWIVPDCGFSQTARWATKRKLAAMVQGAEIVRKELAG